MKHLLESERELSSYLREVINGWHNGPTTTEEDVWEHVRAIFDNVGSDHDRRWLQKQTVDLLEEALTFVRLDA